MFTTHADVAAALNAPRGTTCTYIHRLHGRNSWCGKPSTTTTGMPLCGFHSDNELADLAKAANGPDLSSY